MERALDSRHQAQPAAGGAAAPPVLSAVIAVLNEAENIEAVTADCLAGLAGAAPFEIVYVDDGSTDETAAVIADLTARHPEVRLVRHDRRCGKSQAVRTGVLAARGEWIGTLDGDGQNSAGDLVEMLRLAQGAGKLSPLVAGIRVRRDDPWPRLVATRIANGFRARVLGDRCPDTGCGVKLFRRSDFLRLPCFEGMHRFLPALFQAYGHPLINHPVRHQARLHGTSKYTNLGRALVGIWDVLGVIWLVRRTQAPAPSVLDAAESRA
ncbi:MAG: glycosyltransferase family 2 protein [Phenylobacterium sp.]|nr:glycosyltransferase family 2 protein [Phenylobacterium sp.]